jgi:hypothetical protein
MKTAVEWLFEEFTKTNHLTEDEFYMKFQQAKELEKEQIVNAHYQGYRPSIGTTEISEKYYNETFKQQEQ